MSIRLTDEQRRAITTLDGDLAISAGAGSGKTMVLARRFAEAVAPNPIRPAVAMDRVLTITFTNKAAAELSTRIRRILRTEADPETANCIEDAWISTIHAFCGRIVRRHALECGVAPDFKQADEALSAALREAAFSAAVLRASEASGAAGLFEALPLSELQSRVIACHDNARALGLEASSASLPLGIEEIPNAKSRVIEAALRLTLELEAGNPSPAVVTKSQRLSEWLAAFSACHVDEEERM